MKRLLLSLGLLLGLASPLWASEEIGRQEDSASADGQVLMPVGCVRQDTIASSTSTDGDYSHQKCNNVGRVYGSVTVDAALPAGGNTIGSVNTVSDTPGTGATNLGKAEGGVHANADTGVFSLGVRHDVSTTGMGVDGTYMAFGMNSLGELYTQANTELGAPVALTNNMAVPTVPLVGAVMLCYDNTNIDLCLPGISDTDDNSVAFSQLTSLVIGETHVSDGTQWVRELIYLEDAASANGDQLHIIGAKRTDTPAGQTSADGDYGTLTLDNLNSLWVNCRAGCSGGTQYVEDNPAANADTGTVTLAKRTDAPAGQTSADGDYGTLTLDSLNSLWVNCRTGCSGGTQKAEDSASADGDVGTLAMARRTASPANTSGTDLDYETLQMNAGRLWVSATIDAAIPAGGNTIGTVNIGTMPGTVVEDAAETAGGTGIFALSVRRDTPTTSSNASGDNSTFNTDQLGLLWVRDLDPCNGVAKTFVPINISTATTTQLVAASASNFVYVCSLNLGPTGGAQNIALIEDDTAACASPTAGMAGGTTAASGWNILSGGGHNLGTGISSIAKTAATNRYVCLISSAAVQTSGVMSYVLAP